MNVFRRARKTMDKTPVRVLADGASPIAGPVRNIIEGPSHHFSIDARCGYSGLDIETRLSEYGVTMWNKLALGNKISFNVREAQAQWTEYLLERFGLTILEGAAPKRPKGGNLLGWASGLIDEMCNWIGI